MVNPGMPFSRHLGRVEVVLNGGYYFTTLQYGGHDDHIPEHSPPSVDDLVIDLVQNTFNPYCKYAHQEPPPRDCSFRSIGFRICTQLIQSSAFRHH